MTWKAFILGLLVLVSFDSMISFILYLVWKYIDLKYFSNFEISTLKEEIKFLRNENKKVGGASTDFWDNDKKKVGKL